MLYNRKSAYCFSITDKCLLPKQLQQQLLQVFPILYYFKQDRRKMYTKENKKKRKSQEFHYIKIGVLFYYKHGGALEAYYKHDWFIRLAEGHFYYYSK